MGARVMKVCVFGAGAIGGHVAGRLHAGGAQVSVVARGAHLDAIRASGLVVEAPDTRIVARIAASADPAELGPQDCVVVAVKAPALTSVARAIAPLLGPDTFVAFFMNGIPWWYFHGHGGSAEGRRIEAVDPGGAVWEAIGPRRAVGGVVWSACEVTAPGIVHVSGAKSRFDLGEPAGGVSPRVEALAEAMRRGGLEARGSPNIREDIWRKLAGNLMAAPFAVLTLSRSFQFFTDPDIAAAIAAIAREVGAVGRAMGVPFAQDIEADIAAGSKRDHLASLAQDLVQGRPMEIDALFSVPQAFAREMGVATPTLDLVVSLVKLRARAAGLYPPPAAG
jgi:2-dehydropantoate 2-reductase